MTASIDQTAVSTELGKTENFVITVNSVDGFAGTVTVTPSLVGGTTTNWTVTATPPTVDLAAGASEQVMLAVKIPTDTAALSPMLNVDLTSSAATATVSSAFTVANQYTIVIGANTGTGLHTALPAATTPIKLMKGAKIIFHNADGIDHVIHGDGGIPHENLALGKPNTDYTVTPSDDATWYCHSHEGQLNINRPVLIVQ